MLDPASITAESASALLNSENTSREDISLAIHVSLIRSGRTNPSTGNDLADDANSWLVLLVSACASEQSPVPRILGRMEDRELAFANLSYRLHLDECNFGLAVSLTSAIVAANPAKATLEFIVSSSYDEQSYLRKRLAVEVARSNPNLPKETIAALTGHALMKPDEAPSAPVNSHTPIFKKYLAPVEAADANAEKEHQRQTEELVKMINDIPTNADPLTLPIGQRLLDYHALTRQIIQRSREELDRITLRSTNLGMLAKLRSLAQTEERTEQEHALVERVAQILRFHSLLHVVEKGLAVAFDSGMSLAGTASIRREYIEACRAIVSELSLDLKIAVAGILNAGKSTFLNTLVSMQRPICPTDDHAATYFPTGFTHTPGQREPILKLPMAAQLNAAALTLSRRLKRFECVRAFYNDIVCLQQQLQQRLQQEAEDHAKKSRVVKMISSAPPTLDMQLILDPERFGVDPLELSVDLFGVQYSSSIQRLMFDPDHITENLFQSEVTGYDDVVDKMNALNFLLRLSTHRYLQHTFLEDSVSLAVDACRALPPSAQEDAMATPKFDLLPEDQLVIDRDFKNIDDLSSLPHVFMEFSSLRHDMTFTGTLTFYDTPGSQEGANRHLSALSKNTIRRCKRTLMCVRCSDYQNEVHKTLINDLSSAYSNMCLSEEDTARREKEARARVEPVFTMFDQQDKSQTRAKRMSTMTTEFNKKPGECTAVSARLASLGYRMQELLSRHPDGLTEELFEGDDGVWLLTFFKEAFGEVDLDEVLALSVEEVKKKADRLIHRSYITEPIKRFVEESRYDCCS